MRPTFYMKVFIKIDNQDLQTRVKRISIGQWSSVEMKPGTRFRPSPPSSQSERRLTAHFTFIISARLISYLDLRLSIQIVQFSHVDPFHPQQRIRRHHMKVEVRQQEPRHKFLPVQLPIYHPSLSIFLAIASLTSRFECVRSQAHSL